MKFPTPEVNHIQENDLQKKVLTAHLCVPPPSSNEGIFSRGQSVTVSLDPLKHHPSILPARPSSSLSPSSTALSTSWSDNAVLRCISIEFFSKKKCSSSWSALKAAVYHPRPQRPSSAASPWSPSPPPKWPPDSRAMTGSGDTAVGMTSEAKFRAPPPPRDGPASGLTEHGAISLHTS